jgi:hypothetical protein
LIKALPIFFEINFSKNQIIKMPSFKNITQLELEKTRLLLEINDVEKEIHQNWHDLKTSVKPSNILKQIIATIIENKTSENSSFFSSSNKSGPFKTFSNISKLIKINLANKIKDWIYA